MGDRRSPRLFSRRAAVGMLGAAIAAPFVRLGHAETASSRQIWPEQTTIPDILKGSGEVRIAGFGGTMQEAQMKGYYESFEKLSGIKVRALTDASPTKVKA